MPTRGNNVPALLKDVKTKYKGNFLKYVNELLAGSIYRSKEALQANTQRDVEELLKDPCCNSLKPLSKTSVHLLKRL